MPAQSHKETYLFYELSKKVAKSYNLIGFNLNENVRFLCPQTPPPPLTLPLIEEWENHANMYAWECTNEYELATCLKSTNCYEIVLDMHKYNQLSFGNMIVI